MKYNVFYNGKIYSMAKQGECFEAMSIENNKIKELGTTDYILGKYCSSSYSKIDLCGKTVLPGFIDSHMHLLAYCENKNNVNLSSAHTIDDLKKILSSKVKNTQHGKWIVGFGFDNENFPEKTFPNKYDLDDVSRNNPIFITRFCMHGHVANSLAMKIAGIKNDEKSDGILWENAASPIINVIPEELITENDKMAAIKEACQTLSSFGLTGITPVQGKECKAMEYIGIYQKLAHMHELPMRIYAAFDELPSFGMKSGFGNDMVKYGFFKIYCDGSLGSHTAALSEPYSDDVNNIGILNHTPSEIDRLVQIAYDNDLQIGIHAIGDRGMDIAISAIEKAYYADPHPDPRFRLIHAIVPTPEIIGRMKKLPLILEIQPEFLSTDLNWIENRLGKKRAKLSYPWKTYIKNGFIMTGSSDLPVESANPLWGIYSAVTRENFSKIPAGGWNPQEKLSIYDAISLYTRNAAYASFEENKKGTLEAGKFADFIVLSKNIFEINPESIKDIFWGWYYHPSSFGTLSN